MSAVLAQGGPGSVTDLAALLLARDLVAPETLARARLVQAETREPLDSVLTRLGMVSEDSLAQALAEGLGLARVAAEHLPASAVAADRLQARFLRRIRALPIADHGDRVEVACVDPLDPYAAAALAYALNRPVLCHVARAGDLEQAFDRLYGVAASAGQGAADTADDADVERMRDLASDAPVVRAVNALIARAVEARASDIHLEPVEDGLKLRLRIDGALVEGEMLPAAMKAPVISRIKVMANLDIAERRLPQDGRLRLAVRGQDIDFRVATAPVIHGETVVLRILDRSHLALDFAALGFADGMRQAWSKILGRPHGIVLVTGPTGSGKTTTLYASLADLNTPDRKILTVEDPIEYRLSGISQTQVRHKIGLGFAASLRSFLRQDPDVMMVGEIRDLETVQVAIQAALTGHTILSTLHTNDAPSAVTRLLDMGAEPYLVASTLNAVLAQRLVRRLCAGCRVAYRPAPEAVAALGLDPAADLTFYRPGSCPACGGSGFRGRLAVLELLVMSEAIGRLVLARAEAREITRVAAGEGMQSMLADGLAKVAAGLTTLDDVLRVTREE